MRPISDDEVKQLIARVDKESLPAHLTFSGRVARLTDIAAIEALITAFETGDVGERLMLIIAFPQEPTHVDLFVSKIGALLDKISVNETLRVLALDFEVTPEQLAPFKETLSRQLLDLLSVNLMIVDLGKKIASYQLPAQAAIAAALARNKKHRVCYESARESVTEIPWEQESEQARAPQFPRNFLFKKICDFTQVSRTVATLPDNYPGKSELEPLLDIPNYLQYLLKEAIKRLPSFIDIERDALTVAVNLYGTEFNFEKRFPVGELGEQIFNKYHLILFLLSLDRGLESKNELAVIILWHIILGRAPLPEELSISQQAAFLARGKKSLQRIFKR